MEGLAGDVGTGIRGQKDHGSGEILRYLDPVERDVFFELEKKRTVVDVHRGVHCARRDGVDANVLRSHALSRRSRQRIQGGLRGAIVNSAPPSWLKKRTPVSTTSFQY